jgi:hypothetical protein
MWLSGERSARCEDEFTTAVSANGATSNRATSNGAPTPIETPRSDRRAEFGCGL